MENVLTPSRLVLARKRRAFTLIELARRAGVSVRSLTSYENAKADPTAETVARLAAALDVTVEFLSAPDLDVIPEGAVSFRALSKMSATKRDAALSAGRVAIEIQSWIDERFNLAEPSVPTLDRLDPETGAETLRARWGLGVAPVKNVIHTLEAHGVRVYSLASDCREVDAFSLTWRGVPFVFLNTSKSAERSRFDAAHELGHLVLHSESVPPQGRRAEEEANRFAAAFLMPRQAVVARQLRNATVDVILRERHTWKVAAMALTHRLHELGLLTEWGYRNNCVALSRMGYRSTEPGGGIRETSQVFEKVFQALREERSSPRQIADDLGLSHDEFARHIFGLAVLPVAGDGSRPSQSRAQLRAV